MYIGHGNPMNAIEDSEFNRIWAEVGQSIPKPKDILCISAHWETVGTRVTLMDRPSTIHDFHGFPKPLFDMEYPAPGDPALARLIHDWALEFDAQIKRLISSGDHDAIIHYEGLGEIAKASVPTAEHFLPLLYLLGLQEDGEETTFFNEKVTLGAISMTSVQVGGDSQNPILPN